MAIISDVHGNKEALLSVLLVIENMCIDGIIYLGDLIDYGMHSNEVVRMLRKVKYTVLCNIWGNHEQSIISNHYERFASERGRQCAKYTRSVLDKNTWEYITKVQSNTGKVEFFIEGKRCLAVHGSLEDIYWKAIEYGQDLEEYRRYDYVFSGHSHLPHYFEKFYSVDDPQRRNRKKTIFINPGSVGQPRNLNPLAQFCILNTYTEEITMLKVRYDISREQNAYCGQVDDFYKERLTLGV